MSNDTADQADPQYASPNDALQVTSAEPHEEAGEIQEEEDNNEFLYPPTDRHIWDGSGLGWVHEDQFSIEDTPKMWKLYKDVVRTVTNTDSVIIPDEYVMAEDRPNFDSFALRYGTDFPNTSANVGTALPPAQASAGTMLSAQLQQSSKRMRRPTPCKWFRET